MRTMHMKEGIEGIAMRTMHRKEGIEGIAMRTMHRRKVFPALQGEGLGVGSVFFLHRKEGIAMRTMHMKEGSHPTPAPPLQREGNTMPYPSICSMSVWGSMQRMAFPSGV